MTNEPISLKFFFEQLGQNFSSLALTDQKGLVYYLKYENLADIGTLGFAAKTAQQYLNMQKGDMAILNDPYSGGTILSTMTLVTPFNRPKEDPLLLVVRLGFKPNLIITNTLEEEGVRIPPTPVAQNGHINEAILEAMGSHPLAPEGFFQRIKLEAKNLFDLVAKLSQMQEAKVVDFSNKNLQLHLKYTRDLTREKIEEMPEMEMTVDSKLDSGEIISAHIQKINSKIKIDFRNTSVSKKVCLTDVAAFGSCFGALQAFLDGEILCNDAAFEFLEVSTPLGCMLNAKYPSPTFKGMTDGCNMVASTILKGISHFNQKKLVAFSGVAMSKIQLTFNDGRKFYDYLPGGTGATPSQDGSDGMAYWTRNNLQPSVEEIERRFPLLIRRISVRQISGGKGQQKGGNGLFKQYELLAPAKMSWLLDQTKYSPQGINGALNASPGEVFVYHKLKNQKENLPSDGQIELKEQDSISLLSAGGGGWGKADG